jgi:hypothetical protein
MNGFKNDMDDEKSQKGKDPLNIRTKHQKHNQNASWQCKSTTTPNLQLNHTTRSQSRIARLKPVYR